MTKRPSVITDWRTPDDALPDVLPGGEYARVITLQKPVTLHLILVQRLSLLRLQIGAVEVPFTSETVSALHIGDLVNGIRSTYRPAWPQNAEGLRALQATGLHVTEDGGITIVPDLDVRLTLRNFGNEPAKPRAALIVHEAAS
jgi:hypothetical protein